MVKYEIKYAGFENALALHDAILKEIKATGVNINLKDIDLSGGQSDSDSDGESESGSDIDIDIILKPILGLSSSQHIRDAAFKCLESSLYDGEKITRATFDKIDAVESYYLIMIECVKVNLSPFFKKLVSQLGKLKPEKIISLLK